MPSNRRHRRPIIRGGVAFAALLGTPAALTALTLVPRAAHADVYGRLHFTVTAKASGQPVAGARITLHDTANIRPDLVLTTGPDGTVTTPPLENREWRATIDSPDYQVEGRVVLVAADVTNEVEVALEPIPTGTTTVRVTRALVRTDKTTSSTQRNQAFYRRIPVTVGNEQSLTKALRANPGFAEDSVNQAHPRGEHSATAVYINGFLLPGALQGRAGQFLSPTAVQTLDVITGGYAPEYGGETAAVLNLSLRAGTIDPIIDAQLGGGGFNTFQGVLTVGGQIGGTHTGADQHGDEARRLGYLLNLSQRNTDNAIEPPQPNNQTAHNAQRSTTAFGHLTYHAGPRDEFSLILNTTPARTEVANRTGLPGNFRGRGQGFGYAGLRDADETTTDAQGNPLPLISQQAARQDVYQKDQNSFGTLQWRRGFSDTVTGFLTLGYSRSKLDILNNNPSNGAVVDPSQLPEDSPIEFSPTITRDYEQAQLQGNISVVAGPAHTLKFGALYADQSGDESYQLIPGSQRALNALYATDPRLAPPGGAEVPDNTGGGLAQGATDELGNPIYQLSGPAAAPTLRVKRDGYYAAAFAQDTWKLSRRFTVNYGLRLDSYKQTQNLGQETVKETELSPRINTAYALARQTVARFSYNRLFSQPPLAQGQIIGSAIRPQLGDMVEANVEKQFGANQTAKAAYYTKWFRNQLDTGLLLDGTQIGAYGTVNLERSYVKGFELSYDITPRGNVGLGGYFAWANAVNKPTGSKSTGEELEPYADHDQLNTVSGGVSYTLPSGLNAGLSVYYGSGTFSSIVDEGGKRQPRTEVNLRLASAPVRTGRSGVGFELAVENLFDSRKVINWQSPFSGTRFQQGRRVLLNLNGRF
jgi:outer membrane receptor protein involved in Fe transport